MIVKVLSVSLVLCIALCLGLMLLPGDAYAQESVAKGADKSSATKKGVEQSLGNKEIDEDQLPGTKEMALTAAATIAMIAVWKWL